MNALITFTAELFVAGRQAYERKWSFLGVFAIAFLTSTVLLARADLLPEPTKAEGAIVTADAATASLIATSSPAIVETPVNVEIPAIGIAATVTNPESTEIAALDRELLKGAVRYPTSAKLGEVGNVVLFGHSSYLPLVNNQAYKTFNGIQKLKEGDTIRVSSDSTVYVYKVRTVMHESTTNAAIPLVVSGRVLTLSTCDSFGAVTDRYVVTADFVESHLAST